MRTVLDKIHVGLARVILAAVGLQFFFAGLGLFGATSFRAHQMTGSLIVLASLLLLLLALGGVLSGVRIGLSALLLVLTILQFVLARGPSLLAAFHPVNAVMILFIARNLARFGARADTRSRSAATAGSVG